MLKRIGAIYARDMKRICGNVIALVVALGLCVLPALYAWFNIMANWDPYGKTQDIQVAVANLDQGFEEGILKLNLGDEIMVSLMKNPQIGWRFTGEEEALELVRSGECYGAVVIGEDFSEKMASLLTGSPEKPKIRYYVNEKKNAIAPKITDKGVGAIQQKINEEFSGAVAQGATKMLQLTGHALEENAREISQNAQHSKEETDKLIQEYEKALRMTAQMMESSSLMADSALSLLPEGQQSAREVKEAFSQAGEYLDQMQDTFKDLLEKNGDELKQAAGICRALEESAGSFEKTAETGVFEDPALLQDAQRAAESLKDFCESAGKRLQRVNQALPVPLKGLEQGQKQLTEMAQRAEDISQKAESLSEDLSRGEKNLSEGVKALGRACYDAARLSEELEKNWEEELAPSLEGAISEAGALRGALGQALDKEGLDDETLKDFLEGFSGAAGNGADLLTESQEALHQSREAFQDLREELEGEIKEKGLSLLEQIDGYDPQMVGNFMSSPVEIEASSFYPIENYGSAMAPFYTSLAIWVGGIVLAALLKTRVDEDEKLSALSPAQCYFGRYGLFLSLSLIQASVVCAGDLLLLGIQCQEPFWFMATGWISALVYSLMIYTLTVSFSDIGKAIAVILLVIQIAASGGTFPSEMIPSVFQSLNPFLPFTYGINAMREAVAGPYEAHLAQNLLCLLLFLIPSLLIGLVLRKPFIRLNRFFEKRLEDTHLM